MSAAWYTFLHLYVFFQQPAVKVLKFVPLLFWTLMKLFEPTELRNNFKAESVSQEQCINVTALWEEVSRIDLSCFSCTHAYKNTHTKLQCNSTINCCQQSCHLPPGVDVWMSALSVTSEQSSDGKRYGFGQQQWILCTHICHSYMDRSALAETATCQNVWVHLDQVRFELRVTGEMWLCNVIERLDVIYFIYFIKISTNKYIIQTSLLLLVLHY